MNKEFLISRFTLFVLGTFIPKIADKVYLVAMPWLIYELTHSSFYMGVMFLIETIPFILISPISGVIADKFSYYKILMITLAIQFTGLLTIAAFLITSVPPIWVLFLLGFTICGAGACYWVVYNTAIPVIFKKEELVKANSLFQFSDTLTVIIGASIAAFLIKSIGINYLFLVIAFSFFITLFIIIPFKSSLSHLNKNLLKKKEGLKSEFYQGLIYVYYHKPLFYITIIALIGNIGNGVLVSMLVYLIRNDLGLGALELNYIYVAGGLAEFIALIIVSRLLNRFTSVRLMLISQVFCGIGILIMGLFTNLMILMIGFAIQNAAVVAYNITNRTFRQKIVPQELLGRVNGFNQMLVRSAFPFSGFVAGILVSMITVGNLYTITAILSIIAVIPFYLSSFKNISDEEAQTISNKIIEDKVTM
ncbi:hypothetical protein ACH95_10485 [Bacillus glycinifermentans]|uniref:MFS transporter n=1 Tax=Bacillus glycinifermentans TaxID=1664069 RepID=UPI00065347BE|nr:MFS transporter [Bacillus glycinifermentans]KMM59934.1 hypothetical protein ACH95_10485 [Bacillus glycinifermentans]MEC0493237.1 MFS transporter [Bacillus glycinifermentans]MEC0542535.1 MFS transporter [Bacillus glycinifermentans]UOY90072.1 MFS transporter [Bacillus glycinifermentans]